MSEFSAFVEYWREGAEQPLTIGWRGSPEQAAINAVEMLVPIPGSARDVVRVRVTFSDGTVREWTRAGEVTR